MKKPSGRMMAVHVLIGERGGVRDLNGWSGCRSGMVAAGRAGQDPKGSRNRRNQPNCCLACFSDAVAGKKPLGSQRKTDLMVS
jgi:hypothetical protein